MGILKTAINNKRWDLAAHVLVLATLQALIPKSISVCSNNGGQIDEIANLEPEKQEAGILL